MSESWSPTAEQVAAARLRVLLDRRLGRVTSPFIEELARADVAPGSSDLDASAEQDEPALAPAHVVDMGSTSRTSMVTPLSAGQPLDFTQEFDAAFVSMDLTASQRSLLEAILDLVNRSGRPPSLDEIGTAPDLSPRPAPAYVPVLGRVAAGGPILAEEAVMEVFPLPREIVGDGELFVLRVVGDSMVDAAMADGDWVVVHRQPSAKDGEIVAAMIDGETTVKMLKRTDGHVWLLPRNYEYSPINGDDATILGRVVTVIRRL